MNKKFIILSVVCAVLCVFLLGAVIAIHSHISSKELSANAEQISFKLEKAKLPINNVVVYNEKTDPNKMLGRPNQYISKVNFADTRLDQLDPKNPNGGSIETFKNTDDLKARKEYIESVIKTTPAFTEYMVVNGKYLLRLSKDMTNDQVNKYKKAFMAIK